MESDSVADGRADGQADDGWADGRADGQETDNEKHSDVRLQSRVSALEGPDIDKGWAWVALLASFLIMVLLGSVVPLVGILYIQHLETFGRGPALTACVGSLLIALTSLGGPLAGWLCTRFGRRLCVIAGGILVSASLAISAHSYNFWIVFVTNGILAGIGHGLVTTPSHINIGCYFVRKRTLACGIYVTGFPIGIFLATPCLQYLEEHLGWRGALFIFAGVQLNLCVTGVIMGPSSLEARSKTIEASSVDVEHDDCILEAQYKDEKHRSVYTDVPFYFLVVSFVFTNCSINIVYVHLQRYVYLIGGTDSDIRMLYLALGICGVSSKLLTGLGTGDIKNGQSLDKICLRFGSFSIVAATMFILPSLAYSQTYRLLCLCLVGFYYNIETAMFVPIIINTVGFSNLNTAVGFIHLGIGLGFLIGPPTAAYITALTGNYDNAFYVAGGVNILAAVSVLIMAMIRPTTTTTTTRADAVSAIKLESI